MANYEATWTRTNDQLLLKEKLELQKRLARFVALPSVSAPTPALYQDTEIISARSEELISERAALVAKLQRLV